MWCAIILGGGSGSRMNAGQNKVLLPVGGEAALVRSVRAFAGFAACSVVVIRPEDRARAERLLREAGLAGSVRFADGGDTRQDSVRRGLEALPEGCTHVLVHDGARCLVTPEVIRGVMEGVPEGGAAAAAVPVTDTIRVAGADRMAVSAPDRSTLFAMQTPQGAPVGVLRRAHLAALADGFTGTDDVSLVERIGLPVRLTPGSRRNIKLTTPEDLVMAEALLSPAALQPRVGTGYDVHRLVPGRKLVLCGVDVPHDLGLDGHSDADVALHALMDAMLGALALGDIGQHFPDTDPAYRGVSSLLLLERVSGLLREHRAALVNADVTIAAQKPKLAPYIPAMRQNIADVLGVPVSRVSVKATTTERLGFEGRMEGISAQASVLLSVRE